MGKSPADKKKLILGYLDSAEVTDMKGNFARKIEWLNPRRINEGIENMGMGTMGRDFITKFLDDCAELGLVKKRKPTGQDLDSEPKAQREYKILDSGRELLTKLKKPDITFINKRY